MIYSDAFDALPAEAEEAIYKRMWEVLSGREKGAKYATLKVIDKLSSNPARHQKDLPDYFTRTPL